MTPVGEDSHRVRSWSSMALGRAPDRGSNDETVPRALARALTPRVMVAGAPALCSSCAHPYTNHPVVPERIGPCFENQVLVESFCIDKYEDYLVEVDDRGVERTHSPYEMVGSAVTLVPRPACLDDRGEPTGDGWGGGTDDGNRRE